jgi:tripartite-type tricarboxylate transporter receptor subunit TctC
MFALRPIASTIFLVMLFLGAGQAFAQTYPVKLVRIVAPFAPGGGVDSIARMVAHKLTPALGQTVIVDNRPGAGGNIGIRFAAKSAPDGYTLLIMSSNFSINPSLYGNAGYDPIKDFDPVAPLTSYMLFLVCHPSMPVRSVKELIALAKNQPGKLTYASGGVGTASHFGGEMFNAATGVRMTHVPYKGTGPAITETLGGQVSIMFGVPEVVPHVKSGKLIVLGVTGAKRSAALPKVPTVAESGVPEFEVASWHGMFAPAGTPAAIVNRINEEVRKGLSQPDAMDVLKQQGLEPATGAPPELAALVKTTHTKWGKVAKDVGMKVE